MTRAAAVVLSIILCAIAARSIRPDIIGLFHDDGLYAVVGKSVSEGQGYRIGSLPSEPLETKYPVGYPTVLAAGWRLAGGFPAVIVWLKGLNVVFLFAALLGAWRLFERATGSDRLPALAFTMLVGTNMAVVSYVDMTMTETLFLTLTVWAMALHAGDVGDHSQRVWLPAVIVAFACLTRQAGFALAVAGLIHVAAGRHLRRFLVYLGILIAFVSPWMIWRLLAGETAAGILEAYYTGYERSALETAFVAPSQAARTVGDNVVYLAASIDADLLLPLLPALRWLVYPFIVIGALRGYRRTPIFQATFCVVYVAGVVSHPFHPHRYAMPLVPVVLLWLLQGTAAVRNMATGHSRWPAWRSFAIRALAVVPVALLLVFNLLWLSRYGRASSDGRVRGWQGGAFSYSWDGFAETFEWIRAHTREDDVIGSAYDPMYYLYTGRRGVRPWIHQPETYFYPREHPKVTLGEPAVVRRELERLGVRYLVLDPLDGYAEAQAAPEYWKSLLAAYPVAPRQVFVTRDGRHVVYELPPATLR